jgi:hypothetical protein
MRLGCKNYKTIHANSIIMGQFWIVSNFHVYKNQILCTLFVLN